MVCLIGVSNNAPLLWLLVVFSLVIFESRVVEDFVSKNRLPLPRSFLQDELGEPLNEELGDLGDLSGEEGEERKDFVEGPPRIAVFNLWRGRANGNNKRSRGWT
jgi:hypothetical protein